MSALTAAAPGIREAQAAQRLRRHGITMATVDSVTVIFLGILACIAVIGLLILTVLHIDPGQFGLVAMTLLSFYLGTVAKGVLAGVGGAVAVVPTQPAPPPADPPAGH